MFSRAGMPPRRNTPGFVYILSGDNGLYKIGSTVRLEKRVWEVSHYSGVKSALYFSVQTQNMNKLERYLHKKFENQRVYNEWFDLTPIQLGDAVLEMERGQ